MPDYEVDTIVSQQQEMVTKLLMQTVATKACEELAASGPAAPTRGQGH